MSTANKAKSQQELLEAKKAREAAEKAELKQALMSLYIPLSLFIACCIFAAGVYMVYYEEPAGWGFIGVTCLLALSAFIALFKFQNKFRAKGIIPTKDTVVESNILDVSPGPPVQTAIQMIEGAEAPQAAAKSQAGNAGQACCDDQPKALGDKVPALGEPAMPTAPARAAVKAP
jgi:hypothetical protein